MTIALFYLVAYGMGFALCIMPGPVAIEVFHHALKKQNKHALAIGLGAGVGDGVWALVAFYGITPFLKNGTDNGNQMEGIFLLAAAIITFIIGMLGLKDAKIFERVEKKEEQLAEKVKRKRFSFLKGLMMVMVNPLGIGSWMIVLSFFKKVNIYIPLDQSYVFFFFWAVVLGAFTYSGVMVLITRRIEPLFTKEKTAQITRALSYLLIAFSVYFLFYAINAFFNLGIGK